MSSIGLAGLKFDIAEIASKIKDPATGFISGGRVPMKRSLMLTAAAFLAGGAANADNLNGTYSFVGNDNCLLSDTPFGNIINGGEAGTPSVWSDNGSAQGFAVFNGDGTGTITAHSTAVQIRYFGVTVPGSGATVVSPFTIADYNSTIAFTYTVTGDEFTLTETSDSSVGLIKLLGNAWLNNGALTIMGVPSFNGTISRNTPPVLQMATGTPAQETWMLNGNFPFYVTCLRTRTLTMVKDQPPATN